AHPIAVGRRRAVDATWLAAVFDIDPEDDAPLGPLAVGEGVVADTREADLVGRRARRLGSADAVAGVAQGPHDALTGWGEARTRCTLGGTVGRGSTPLGRIPAAMAAGEAGAHQAVVRPRVEVPVQARPDVADVRPFAPDARTTRAVGAGVERRRDPDGRSNLSTVGRVERCFRTAIGRAGAGGARVA